MSKVIPVELEAEEALALAQFCNRCCWQYFRECSTSDIERVAQIRAIDKLRQALAEAGYAPR